MTAAVQPETKSPSRRAVLAAAAGAAAAFAARAIASPTKVEGADTGPINIGGTYADVQAQTTLGNQANDDIVLWIASNGGGTGGGGAAVVGFSDHAVGVSGANGVFPTVAGSYGVVGSSGVGVGVRGTSETNAGVSGQSNSNTGVYGESTSQVGIYGRSFAANWAGSVGHSSNNGTGVHGFSTAGLGALTAKAKTGVYGYANQDSSAKGIYGQSSKGYAGYFAGKVYMSSFQEMPEISVPTAPPLNRARLFVRDNGSGKSQLCVRFNTGGVLVIKTQP